MSTSKHILPGGIEISGSVPDAFATILTTEALEFVGGLFRDFKEARSVLLEMRTEVQKSINAGHMPDFQIGTRPIRASAWSVAETPDDLQDRRVEITGPVERKMMINALNSGANVFMADFEDANSPTWENVIRGQINLIDAIDGTIAFTSPDGKKYQLNQKTAVLMVRPRGWHLVEKHVLVDGEPISASLFDFGLYMFHNLRRLILKGSAPYFYLPKLENHLEARLWNDVFNRAQTDLNVPRGTIRATVLIENILAAFQMEEILYELREHSAGLNAGRWDYIFSIIKKFRNRPDFVLPDRDQVTMGVPFMRAYAELLVSTCHKRGAHAIGGMAAFIPSRRDEDVNRVALQKVREDKERESRDGFDGTWVAHPDLVPLAREIFDGALGQKPNQKDRLREDVKVTAADLLNFSIPNGTITEDGLRHNVNVSLMYLESWLQGNGAAAIYNLMEDTATAEISRSQIWQWLHHKGTKTADGRPVSLELYQKIVPEEMDKIKSLLGEKRFNEGWFKLAGDLLDTLVTRSDFPDFLTLIAYQHLN